MSSDPAQHRMVPQQRWFEDFTLDERFVVPSRTMTSGIVVAFQWSGSPQTVRLQRICRSPWLAETAPAY